MQFTILNIIIIIVYNCGISKLIIVEKLIINK